MPANFDANTPPFCVSLRSLTDSKPPTVPQTGIDSDGRWSAQIENHLGCRLESSLADWFDDGIWQVSGGNEFQHPLSPQRWLEPTMDPLWPGLMACHLMPLIGNSSGDYLAVRIDDAGTAAEIVHWYHGGGDWIPWGKTLAQAILIDEFSDRLPGLDRRHAVAVERRPPAADETNGWLPFALKHVDTPEITKLSTAESQKSSEPLADCFIDNDIGRLAVLAGRAAAAVNVNDQDEALNRTCEMARSINPHLAWTWDVAGRVAESEGNIDQAVELYTRGSRCSVYTSQSVRMRTHAHEETVPKFSVARLQHIAPEVVRNDDYLRRLILRTRRDRQEAIHNHWMAAAAEYPIGDRAQLFALHMAAWDVGLWSMDAFGDAIQSIAECCEAAGLVARANVARLHLRTLRKK